MPARPPSITRPAGPIRSLSKDHFRKKLTPKRMATMPTQVAQRAPMRCSRSRVAGRDGALGTGGAATGGGGGAAKTGAGGGGEGAAKAGAGGGGGAAATASATVSAGAVGTREATASSSQCMRS